MIEHNTFSADTDSAGRAFRFLTRLTAASFVALLAGLLIPHAWIELATWTAAVAFAALACLVIAALAIEREGRKHG